MEYFLKGNNRNHCHVNDLQRIGILKENIDRASRVIDPQTIHNVLQIEIKRIEYCQYNQIVFYS